MSIKTFVSFRRTIPLITVYFSKYAFIVSENMTVILKGTSKIEPVFAGTVDGSGPLLYDCSFESYFRK
jgi:hypothetical protein